MSAYEPELWRLQQRLSRTEAELRAERDAHAAYRIKEAKEKLLAQPDVAPNMGEIFDGMRPRLDDQYNVILDYDEDKAGPVSDAEKHWRATPEKWGTLVGVQKAPEPSPQQKRYAELAGMDMDKYTRERKQPDFFRPKPEPPTEPNT